MDIKKICNKYNKTLTEVAESIKTSRNNLSIIMRGNPTLATINKVASALNIPTHILIKELNDE